MLRRSLIGLTWFLPVLLARGSGVWSIADREHFLLTARVESEAPAGKGIAGTKKAILSDGRRTHAAHIQQIDVYMPEFHGKDGSRETDFRDSWKFNVAAYRLAKLLDLANMVPTAIARVVDGKPSSVSWWVDDVLMDERERVSRHIDPPEIPRWNRQMDTIRIFDQLIYNMDRSQENLLITKNWDVWMIDHTRSFRKWPTLRNPAAITHCSPGLFAALRRLRREEVTREIGQFVTADEIDGLMARRDLILQKLESDGLVR